MTSSIVKSFYIFKLLSYRQKREFLCARDAEIFNECINIWYQIIRNYESAHRNDKTNAFPLVVILHLRNYSVKN